MEQQPKATPPIAADNVDALFEAYADMVYRLAFSAHQKPRGCGRYRAGGIPAGSAREARLERPESPESLVFEGDDQLHKVAADLRLEAAHCSTGREPAHRNADANRRISVRAGTSCKVPHSRASVLL